MTRKMLSIGQIPLNNRPISGFDWLDPKVTDFTYVYLDRPSISSFIGNHTILKSDASDCILVIGYCWSTDTICMGRFPSQGHFFFVYSFLLPDLHVAIPFDDFTMGVLRTLNVPLSQLHPNNWASLQTFRLICDMFRLSPIPFTFLSYYTSHPTDLVSWLLLINRWVIFCLALTPPLTKISKKSSSNFLFSPRVRVFSLTKQVSPICLYIGLRTPLDSRNGFIRFRVPRN